MLLLWTGVSLTPDGSQCVRAALLAVAADLPAIRKVTQFLGHKADYGCSRCKFRAKREAGTTGASGLMSYYTPSACVTRSHQEVCKQAKEFMGASTKSKAAKIAQKNGVRYSELIRLPYFDIVRMTTVDPMHTFLLGMVKRETELNLSMLTPTDKSEFLRRLQSMKLPYDIGRLPSHIFDDDMCSNSRVTADQWKTYIITCARPCMYSLLPQRAYKCLVLLSQIVAIISSPVLTQDDVVALSVMLHEHHNLFRRVYGEWSVSVNYHMCLHMPEIILDYGPPQAFWCFPFERMNGKLAGTPHSNRCVEVEVVNRFMRDFTYCHIELPSIDGFDIPGPLKEFCTAECDTEIESYPLTVYVLTVLNGDEDERLENQLMVDRGDVNDWPLQFHHPCKKNVRTQASFLSELKEFFQGLYGSSFEFVRPRINKYGRCSVNGQNFSSDFNSTDRSSIVKVMFVEDSNQLAPYFGRVKFYFTVTAVVDQQPKTHHLSYVNWMKFKADSVEKMSKLYMVTKNYYQKDRIISPRRYMCRCVLAGTRVNPSFQFVSELSK